MVNFVLVARSQLTQQKDSARLKIAHDAQPSSSVKLVELLVNALPATFVWIVLMPTNQIFRNMRMLALVDTIVAKEL